MQRLDQSIIEQIRQQTDIVQVIGQYLPLVQKGNSIRAICPFHDDHDPSMNISAKKQIFKCFVCGATGNVFGFVERYEHLNFPQAVKRVADLCNIPFDYHVPQAVVEHDPHQRLHDLLAEAVNFQQYQLNLSDYAQFAQYLNNRQVTPALIEQFKIGYQPGEGMLIRFLKHKGYSVDELITANIVSVDRPDLELFGQRITFPIADEVGRVIGFTARSLNPDQPKYLNSSTSLLYHKSKIVYNYHLAKQPAQQHHQVIVVEGVMDVIAFAKIGVMHVVATLGTAATLDQLKKIRQLSPNIILCYDGDSAGLTATFRLGKLALENHISLSVVNNPTGDDPDEILTKQGKSSLAQLLDKPITFLEFAFNYVALHVDLDNYAHREKMLSVMVPLIKMEPNEGLRQFIKSKLEKLLGSKVSVKTESKRVVEQRQQRFNGLQIAQLEIINQMILATQGIVDYQRELGVLPDMALNRLAMTIIKAQQQQLSVNYADLFSFVEASDLQELLSTVEEFQLKHPVYDAQLMMDNINRVKANFFDQRIDEIDRLMKATINEESKKILINERIECIKSRDKLLGI
jgi:DNA primase